MSKLIRESEYLPGILYRYILKESNSYIFTYCYFYNSQPENPLSGPPLEQEDNVQKSTFVITPMSFIVGLFFSLETLPGSFHLLSHMIPLTHYTVVLLLCALFFFLAMRQVCKAVS